MGQISVTEGGQKFPKMCYVIYEQPLTPGNGQLENRVSINLEYRMEHRVIIISLHELSMLLQ